MYWLAAYLLTGVVVFFSLRVGFKKAKIDPKAHDKIWTCWFISPEGWLFPILCWPFLLVLSLAWFCAELFHAAGKKEIAEREDIEAKRDKTYDHLTLEQKIALLESESQKKK